MRFMGIATDYDGTLAHDGAVDQEVVTCLKKVRTSGRKLILVTGRHLPDLLKVFPELGLFDRVVVENGALLYRPASHEEELLVDPVPENLVRELEKRKVQPLAVGRGIVATLEPHENTVLETIRELGLEYHVAFNKGAVMILPSGINKATGVTSALAELNLSWHNIAGFGDAENDHAFLRLCECSVAVANALESLKETADIVTQAERGHGVLEALEALLADDLRRYESNFRRAQLELGVTGSGNPVNFPSSGSSMLLAGPSGGGKSTAAFGILERLAERGYQFCVFDPEGDYSRIKSAVALGTAEQEPNVEEIMQVLIDPGRNVTINLVALPIGDRPQFLTQLLPRLQELRLAYGRPHWIVVDEAHHFMPPTHPKAIEAWPEDMSELLLVTVHPRHIAPAALARMKILVAMGASPERTVAEFNQAVGQSAGPAQPVELHHGEALVWFRDHPQPAAVVRMKPGTVPTRRHRRKYAQGELGPDNSFYFRGPEERLNLRAQNLEMFVQLAEGIDDATWIYHLKRGDYSYWFSRVIKDQALASEVERIEQTSDLSAAESRAGVKTAIEKHFTGAA
jgi:HAD superfamily hydrolase (TIGR01484 family)